MADLKNSLFAVTRPWVPVGSVGQSGFFYFGGQSLSSVYVSMQYAVIIDFIFIFYILRRNKAVNR